MKPHAVISSLIIAVLTVPFIFSAGKSADSGRISFLIGEVHLSRKGLSLKPKIKTEVMEKDVFHLGNDSRVTISLGSSKESLSITGPTVFIFHAGNLKDSVERGNTLWRIARKISRNTPHYYPRTIVSAVRGAKESDRKEKERLTKIMNRAIDKYMKGNINGAWKDLEDLNGSKLLNRHGGALVSFYRAGILFERGNFEKAIEIYSEVSNVKIPGFKFSEESLARAYLCALYLGEPDRAAQIRQDYFKRFGTEGAFRETMEIQP